MNVLSKHVVQGFAIASLSMALPAFAADKPNKQMQEVYDAMKAKGGKPIETLDAKEARLQPSPADAVATMIAAKNIKVDKSKVVTEDIMIDGAAGKIAARVYKPAMRKANLPLIVYYHGGGFVIATNDTYDASARALSEQTEAVVLSVEYRKAPENKFPAAHDDAFAAYQWGLKNATSLGADASRVAVAGESAGANLALNTAIKARDMKVQLPVHELLVYPVAGNDMNTQSYKDNAAAKPLNKPMMAWFVKNYTRTPADAKDTRINLMEANFKGLNPATIITAQIDPLRSEGKGLSEKMGAQGVKVNYKNYEGVSHEFFGMAAVLDEAKSAQKFGTDDLKEAFKSSAVTGR